MFYPTFFSFLNFSAFYLNKMIFFSSKMIALFLLLSITSIHSFKNRPSLSVFYESIPTTSHLGRCKHLMAKHRLVDIKCSQPSRRSNKKEMKFICLHCQEDLKIEKEIQKLMAIEDQREKIYRTRLANRVKSSILTDFLTMRY